MRAFLTGVAVGLLASAALARPPPGGPTPFAQWFHDQHSVPPEGQEAGIWCCDIADGHLLDDSEWRISGDHYEVLIQGEWHAIHPYQMVDPRGGPNPTGKAVVWYNLVGSYEGGLQIYCFTPGWES